MTNHQAITRLVKDNQVRKTIRQLLTAAYRKAKRATRAKWKQHARPMNWRELRALARDDYPAYLRTDHWSATRRAATKRANYTCEKCGNYWVLLHVHHLNYDRVGRERPQDLRVLCGDCHGREHGK